mmetsp:Transcript_36377/g.36626  ORF Transcript_36377/g.36626 Transcript_36377/m.36626 type:complete len:100 (+) Transcript_36377:333-632(+)
MLSTIVEGNSIGGGFSLGFLDSETRFLPHDVSSEGMKNALLEDMPNITTVGVIRTNPRNNCNDGFCQNGPTIAGGYIWTLTLTTTIDNISPFSPNVRNI